MLEQGFEPKTSWSPIPLSLTTGPRRVSELFPFNSFLLLIPEQVLAAKSFRVSKGVNLAISPGH